MVDELSETVDTNDRGRSYDVHDMILDPNELRNLLVTTGTRDNVLIMFTWSRLKIIYILDNPHCVSHTFIFAEQQSQVKKSLIGIKPERSFIGRKLDKQQQISYPSSCLFMYLFIQGDSSSITSQNICFTFPRGL